MFGTRSSGFSQRDEWRAAVGEERIATEVESYDPVVGDE
jgi:hypothetical protein